MYKVQLRHVHTNIIRANLNINLLFPLSATESHDCFNSLKYICQQQFLVTFIQTSLSYTFPNRHCPHEPQETFLHTHTNERASDHHGSLWEKSARRLSRTARSQSHSWRAAGTRLYGHSWRWLSEPPPPPASRNNAPGLAR